VHRKRQTRMPPRKDTAFPTARIKKMMQADEEVGKV
jgi:hypothetical protein